MANSNGPYLGLVIPNLFEMNPLLESSNYTSANRSIDIAGNNTSLEGIEFDLIFNFK